MIGIIVGVFVLAAMSMLFIWLILKAWRAHRALVKWLGIILAGLFSLVFAVLIAVSAIDIYKLYRHNTVSITEMTVAGTPDQIARGEHLSEVLCSSCHSLNGDLPLSGGKNLSEDAGLPRGDIFVPNLTPATDMKDWSDSDLFRAIRTGVDDEGRATAMTSVVGTHALRDEDTLAIIAYLRQSPAVENETSEFKPTIRLLEDLNAPRVNGSYNRHRTSILKCDHLILDDFGLQVLPPAAIQDLYEIICERYARSSILVTSNCAFEE